MKSTRRVTTTEEDKKRERKKEKERDSFLHFGELMQENFL